MIKRIKRYSLSASAIIPSLLLGGCVQTKEKVYPNIVYILADDMGYGDISVLNGRSKIQTPNIDNLAKEGVIFTSAHTSSAVSTPTRYGILTGRYCWRSRLKKGVLTGFDSHLIEEGRATIGTMLQKSGYTTACVGKWHLGLDYPRRDIEKPVITGDKWSKMITDNVDWDGEFEGGPSKRGFDYSYILPASLDMAPYCYIENGKLTKPMTDTTGFHFPERGLFWRYGDMQKDFDHHTVLQEITDKAVGFIDKEASESKPFFLYFPLTAPHTPWTPTEDSKGKSEAGLYGDFVVDVDVAVGRIMKILKDKGIADNTIVVVTSDNGAHWKPEDIQKYGHQANHKFSGMKSDVWEGGHHVPFIVHWPNGTKKGSVSNEVICSTDLFATCADLVDYNLKNNEAEDSYSFLPILKGQTIEKTLREATVHHGVDGMFSIRKGKWKFIDGKGSGGWTLRAAGIKIPGQLYDMSEDIEEKNNLYTKKPNVVKKLKILLEKYKSQSNSRPLLN